ncbi:MAG: aryl-sulfate sulfotransferase [Myxococcota bacterium]
MLVACRPGDRPLPSLPAPGPVVTESPSLSTPPDAPLARRLRLAVDRPARLVASLAADDGETTEVAFDAVSDAFDVPLLGFAPDRDTIVTLTVIDPDTGVGAVLDPLLVHPDPLPPTFPTIEVLANDPDRREPGYWLLSFEVPGGTSWLAVLDPGSPGSTGACDVVWLYTGEIDWGDIRATDRGTLFGLSAGAIEMDWLGGVIGRWFPGASGEGGDVSIPWPLHHEGYVVGDGSVLSLVASSAEVPAYPESYDDPTPTGPATVADDHVVRFSTSDGEVQLDRPLSTMLDTARIGFGSLLPLVSGFDWVHANAIVPWPGGGLLLSVRHQDAMVKLSDAGDVEWILGDPAGWNRTFTDRLLTPTDGTRWMYHQHGPDVDEDGQIVVFDNRMFTRTPYTPDTGELPESRVVAYAVDAEARTVTERWSWAPAEPLLSNALGNAAWLPVTGHALADFGFLDGERGQFNAELGLGRKSVRLIELDPTDPDPVVDVRLSNPIDVASEGVTAYRVFPIGSMYAGIATVTLR